METAILLHPHSVSAGARKVFQRIPGECGSRRGFPPGFGVQRNELKGDVHQSW
jgi:hypothetical protein